MDEVLESNEKTPLVAKWRCCCYPWNKASSSNSAPNDNRLALLAASSAAEVNSSGESSLVQEEDQQPHRFPLFNYEVCINLMRYFVYDMDYVLTNRFCLF